jgi:hypothetical protein
MSISFHCEQCKQKIKAPDDSGGKWGNCPHCNHSCYIPRPPSPDDEELKLAPIGESEEERYNRLMRETLNLTQNILQERELPDEAEVEKISEKELLKHIIVYLRYVSDGDLGMASKHIIKIKPHSKSAREILKRMAKAERPEPELLDIPPKVLRGLIKKLYIKLK